MPEYTFEDINTGEQVTLEMKIAEREEFLASNPHYKQVLKSCVVLDPVKIGVTKPPADFRKHVLGKVRDKVPQAKVENRWTIPKEV